VLVTARLLVLIAAVAIAGCGEVIAEPVKTDSGSRAAKQGTPAARPHRGTALAALEQLEVKGRAPKTGYDRDQFGGDWASIDGCDTRSRILARDMREQAHTAGGGCLVASGILEDPYTGRAIRFRLGGPSEVDIDHVVALSDAWQKGAQQWSYQRRVEFANDPLNLLAVDASANRQKGDGDAATWLPGNKRFRCAYVARQIAVKRRYRASVTAAEREAMARVLARCPGTRLPAGRPVRISVQPKPAGAPAPRNVEAPAVFANCDAVRAAGRGPIKRGDRDYEANVHMDRDRDGVACES